MSAFIFDATAVCASRNITPSMNTGIVNQGSPRSPINTSLSTLSMVMSGSQQVNIFTHTSEPAPMGIADYGIGPNGAYQYNTSSFLGVATISSLSTRTLSNDSSMTFQLNVILNFTSNNTQHVYWIQDFAWIDTSSKEVVFSDNVWNSSVALGNMTQSGITGSGQVVKYPTTGQSYYGYVSSSASPGNEIYLQYPAIITLNVTCSLNAAGKPTVSFGYEDGFGFVTYDTVTFTTSYPITSFSGFVVSGYSYNPTGYLFYDAELVLTGAWNGANTTLLQSNVGLQ